MFSKNNQNKVRQNRKNEIKEESYLNYTTILNMLFVSLFFLIFHQINLLNIHKNVFVFLTLSLSVTIITQKERGFL